MMKTAILISIVFLGCLLLAVLIERLINGKKADVGNQRKTIGGKMATKEQLVKFVDEKIGKYSEILAELTREEQTGASKLNQHALGELEFYCNLSVVLERGISKDEPVVAGMMDGINDLLQDVGIIRDGTTFFSEGVGVLGTDEDVQENDVKNIQRHISNELDKILQQSTDNKGVNTRIFEQAKIRFYVAVQNTIEEEARPCDVGLVDAVNDTLQFLGYLESETTFYA